MAIDYTKQTFTFTEPVRMIWPTLPPNAPKTYVPKVGKPGAPKYLATFLIEPDHPDLIPLKELIVATWNGAYPGRQIDPALLPIKSGTTLADTEKAKGKDYEYCRGCAVFTTGSPRAPLLAVFSGGNKVSLTTDALLAMHKGQFYSGVDVFPSVVINAYEIGSKGINAYLNMVLSANTGEAVGGGRDANDVFKHIKGQISQTDPTAGKETLAW
jgi:hypothetical protein